MRLNQECVFIKAMQGLGEVGKGEKEPKALSTEENMSLPMLLYLYG